MTATRKSSAVAGSRSTFPSRRMQHVDHAPLHPRLVRRYYQLFVLSRRSVGSHPLRRPANLRPRSSPPPCSAPPPLTDTSACPHAKRVAPPPASKPPRSPRPPARDRRRSCLANPSAPPPPTPSP